MKISIQCQCGKQYQVKPELAGKKVKCQECGTPISVPAGTPAKAESPPKKGPAPAAKSKPPAAKAGSAAKAAPAAKPTPGAAPKAAPPKKAAAPAPSPAADPLAAPLHNILDEAMAGAARLPNPGEMFCPGCNAIVQAANVICIKCGRDLQSGRATRVSSEANKVKRKPGQMPLLGIFVALVSMLYGLAGAVFFTICLVGSFIVLAKLGLPTGESGESAAAMFGLPVHILLSVAGLLMFVSGIGIFRYSKGATLNAGLGAKIYFWMLLVLMVLSVGNAIYKSTAKAKEAAAQAEAASGNKKPEEPVDLGHAQRLTASSLSGLLRVDVLAMIIGLFLLLLAPPAFVWAWSATQGRQWDWELPEPVHKLKLKRTAKVGGPQAEPQKK